MTFQKQAEKPSNTIEFVTAPSDGKSAIERRLKNLIELAISVGRKEGLLGKHPEGNTSYDDKSDRR
jgi:hypothetical protein